MPKGIYKPNDTLFNVLKQKRNNEFTVTEIRDLLLENDDVSKGASDLRRWVNGQFKTMLKHGYIQISLKSGVRTTYKNTQLIPYTVPSSSYKKVREDDLNTNKMMTLKTRLKDYQLQMLISSAETKEFEELSELFPELREHIQAKFNLSKERNIDFIGRVNAIESLIADYF